MKKYFILLGLYSAVTIAGEQCLHIDKTVEKQFIQLAQYDNYEEKNQANTIIKSVLKEYARNNASLNCTFKQAQKHLTTSNSNDQRFKTFYWDDMMGGTMRNYEGFIQAVDSKDNVIIKPLQEGVKSIYSTTIDGKPTYILVTYSIRDSRARGQTITLYQISHNKLVSPNLFQTSKLTNKVSFDYESFSVTDSNHERPLVQFDEKTNTLRFPVVVDDEKYPYGRVTNKWIRYRLSNGYFRHLKN